MTIEKLGDMQIAYMRRTGAYGEALYTGGSLIAQKKVAQAEEALDQLTTDNFQ